jgi:hypothetical protein
MEAIPLVAGEPAPVPTASDSEDDGKIDLAWKRTGERRLLRSKEVSPELEQVDVPAVPRDVLEVFCQRSSRQA